MEMQRIKSLMLFLHFYTELESADDDFCCKLGTLSPGSLFSIPYEIGTFKMQRKLKLLLELTSRTFLQAMIFPTTSP